MTHNGARRPVDRYGFLNDPDGRRLRGRRIVNALADFGGVDVARATMLDVGCSAGIMTEEMATAGAAVVGTDVDVEALRLAAARAGRAAFVAASGERLPFAAGAFDAVVCNHVYEHVADAHALIREIHRVLRPGGACYFAAGHRLQPIEPHHRVPLLSWMPRRVAGACLRALGRAERYDERFVMPWTLRGLLRPFERIEFISARMLRDPERYGFPQLARWPAAVREVLLAGGVLARLAPTWIYMLRKG